MFVNDFQVFYEPLNIERRFTGGWSQSLERVGQSFDTIL